MKKEATLVRRAIEKLRRVADTEVSEFVRLKQKVDRIRERDPDTWTAAQERAIDDFVARWPLGGPGADAFEEHVEQVVDELTPKTSDGIRRFLAEPEVWRGEGDFAARIDEDVQAAFSELVKTEFLRLWASTYEARIGDD